jgi:NAD(P)-dependent dehydrogenase (short-subunit alcohol dehydrogenase family)
MGAWYPPRVETVASGGGGVRARGRRVRGALDVLVNNAGVISWRPFVEQGFVDLDTQVNVTGVMKLTWCFLPLVSDAVITVGSTAALHRSRTPPPYCATKRGPRGEIEVEPGGDVDLCGFADA